MTGFNEFNDTIKDGVFTPLMEAEVTGAAMVFLVMQRIGAYGFILALIFTGFAFVWKNSKSQEYQELKQKLVRIAIGLVLFFAFFTIVGLVGDFIDGAFSFEGTGSAF